MLNNDDLNRKKEAFEKNYHAFEAERFYRFRRPWLIRAAVSSTILAMALGIGWLVDHAINLNKLNEANSRYSALEEEARESDLRYSALEEKLADYNNIKKELAVLKQTNGELQQLRIANANLAEKYKSIETRLATSSDKKKDLVALDEFFMEKSEKYSNIADENLSASGADEWESCAAKFDMLYQEISREDERFSNLPTRSIDVLLYSIKRMSGLYKEIAGRMKSGSKAESDISAARAAIERWKKEFEDYKKKAEAEISDLKSKYKDEQKRAVEAISEIEKQKAQVANLEKRLKDAEKARDDAVQGLKAYSGTHSHTDSEYAAREKELISLRENADNLQARIFELQKEYRKTLINGCTRAPKKDGVRYIYFHIDYYTQRDPPKLKEVGGEWDLASCKQLDVFDYLIKSHADRSQYLQKAKSSGFRFARVEAESAGSAGDKYYFGLVFNDPKDNCRIEIEVSTVAEFIKYVIINK